MPDKSTGSKAQAEGANESLAGKNVNEARTGIGRGRKPGDIKFNGNLTKAEVTAKWGLPDANVGFGMVYNAYTMENGEQVWLIFNQDEHLHGARVLIDGKNKILFDAPRSLSPLSVPDEKQRGDK